MDAPLEYRRWSTDELFEQEMLSRREHAIAWNASIWVSLLADIHSSQRTWGPREERREGRPYSQMGHLST